MVTNDAWLEQLDYFLSPQRQAALIKLHQNCPGRKMEKPWVNMHVHSFFSFNGEGWSPSRIAWEAYRHGLYAIGLCDFDSLAGVKEILSAGDILGVRSIASIESRVLFTEYSDQEINSPGEPGVFYFIGAGFTAPPDPAGEGGRIFQEIEQRAYQRNLELVNRINSRLPDLELDYDQEVLPLTPADKPTERHIIRAYFDKSLLLNRSDLSRTASWWAMVLSEDAGELEIRTADLNKFLDYLRNRLIKEGGIAYSPPAPESFPPLDRMIKMILACRAVPTSAWLDGCSPGESDPQSQLECLLDKGLGAVNIVPDRNWNYQDPHLRKTKIANLNRYIEIADRLDLPILAGTEMNKSGQRFVDDFEAGPMKKIAGHLLRGAQIMVGHTRLLRYADFSYVDRKAGEEFPGRKKRNDFFASVGSLPVPDGRLRTQLEAMEPDKAYALIHDSAVAGEWKKGSG